jgi:NAD(P)-dependent dehydrogenase (short-subunit alcohol dehydrogenase family)
VVLEGKCVIVTGAGSGLGRQIALACAEAGARLGLIDLDADAGTRTLTSCGGDGIAVDADVADEAALEGAMSAIRAELDDVDVVVNNAGIGGVGPPKPAHVTTRVEWERVMAVNVIAPAMIARSVLPAMMERRSGVIVNVASAVGMIAFVDRSPYAASKGALIQLTRTLAVEYAAHGIRVNALCPGWMETPLTRARLDQPGVDDLIRTQVPMGRVADPREVADAAVFLASDASRYMTGQTLVVDGGWTAH